MNKNDDFIMTEARRGVPLSPLVIDQLVAHPESLTLTGAVIVTTPQQVALSDVVRGVKMFEQLHVPILGVVENMSYFVAPDTGHRYDIFGNITSCVSCTAVHF